MTSTDTGTDYQLHPYRPEWKQGVLQLLGDEPHKRLLWDWQFAAARSADNGLVVAISNGEVVGFNGAMPIRIQVAGEQHPAMWSCDFHVAAAFRGQGLGKAIKQELHRRCDHIMSLGISDLATPVLEKSGWRKGTAVYSLRRYQGWSPDRRLLLRPWQRYLAWRQRLPATSGGLTLDWQWQLPDDSVLERLWATMSQHPGPMVVRDPQYLRWRYASHPLGHYRYLTVSSDGQIQALAVVRCQDEQAMLVDYLGPRQAPALKQALFGLWLQLAAECRHLSLHTSDQELVAVAGSNGFRTVGEQRFYIHDQRQRYHDWFIMAGDSDGELLAAARASVLSVAADGAVTANMSDGWFASAEGPWRQLLALSDADPLFMSWPWLFSWWRCWGRPLALELRLLAHWSPTGQLLALAPMQAMACDSRWGRRQIVQLLGGAWGKAPTVRTEYGSWLAPEPRYFLPLWQALATLPWRELVLCDVNTKSSFHAFIRQQWPRRRVFNREPSYTITTDAFDAYLARLGSNSRFQLLNRRRQLFADRDNMMVPTDCQAFAGFLDDLNSFHLDRWGKRCFDELATRFHLNLCQLMPANSIDASTIRLHGETVCVLYNIRSGDTVYNIQQGYNQRYSGKFSLGTIHLGLAIEAYCRDPGIHRFRLLVGKGKNSDYKARLAAVEHELEGCQILRSWRWRCHYWLRDHLVMVRDRLAVRCHSFLEPR